MPEISLPSIEDSAHHTGAALPHYVLARVREKRGNAAVHEHFPAAQTALLVVDMQCYYASRISGIEHILPRVQRLCAALRSRGATIIWLLNTLERDGVDLWPAYHAHFFDAATAASHRAGLASRSAGHALLPGLVPATEDLRLEKTRFSAFAPGSSSLEAALQARGINSIVIAGVATNVCCESTARDAMMRDYRVAVVGDATAAVTPEDHVAGLATLASCFADVRSTEDVLDRLVR